MNIAKPMAYAIDQENAAIKIITKFCKNGSLKAFLGDCSQNRIELHCDLKWRMAVNVVVGLHELHQQNIVHGNIKTQNFLLKVRTVVVKFCKKSWFYVLFF